jgi:hypothetical protein
MNETTTLNVKDRQILSEEYDKLSEKFMRACHNFDDFRATIQEYKPEIADDPHLNWHLDFEAIHKLNFCLFLVSPTQNIEIPKIRNSVEFIKDVSKKVISVINNVEVDTKTKTISQNQNFLKVKNLFMETEKTAAEIQDKIFNTMESDDTISECSNYHQSILDMEFISKILNSIICNITEDIKKEKKELGGITAILNTVKKRINLVANRFKGNIAHFGTRMLESLDTLGKLSEGLIEKVSNKILDTFISISTHFLDLVENLTGQMFKFLMRFGSLAKEKGYKVSKIDIKFPSIKFETVPLFTFNIPLPKIESPEVLISVENKNIQ